MEICWYKSEVQNNDDNEKQVACWIKTADDESQWQKEHSFAWRISTWYQNIITRVISTKHQDISVRIEGMWKSLLIRNQSQDMELLSFSNSRYLHIVLRHKCFSLGPWIPWNLPLFDIYAVECIPLWCSQYTMISCFLAAQFSVHMIEQRVVGTALPPPASRPPPSNKDSVDLGHLATNTGWQDFKIQRERLGNLCWKKSTEHH